MFFINAMNESMKTKIWSGKPLLATLAAVPLSLMLTACGGGSSVINQEGDSDMNPDSGKSAEPTLYFSNSLGTSGLANDGTYPTTQTRIVFTDITGTGKNGPLASD